jgi:pimeloyl-ACP methyl ester carboxylesterase
MNYSTYPDVYKDDELRQITMPTLLLIGAEDKIYNPKKAIQRAQQLMPNLTGEIIPNLGHILFMDKPELINSRILKFLSGE